MERVALPRNFLALGLTVLDLEQDEYDADGARAWIVIGGTATRQPSYAAFVAARDIGPVWFGGASRFRPRQSVDVADSLKRYFPSHPAGWAYAPASSSSSAGLDMFRFFKSGERKYASLYERLWPAKGLDAERLHHMAMFANAIQELSSRVIQLGTVESQDRDRSLAASSSANSHGDFFTKLDELARVFASRINQDRSLSGDVVAMRE